MSESRVCTDNERTLLIALVAMAEQYLDKYDDEVDSRSMSAGEHAIEALAAFGLMDNINTRFGRWTEAGNRFRVETNRFSGLAPAEPVGGVKLVGRAKPEG